MADPDDPYRYVEIRGTVESIDDDDPKASFHRSPRERYDNFHDIPDADVRGIMTVRPESFNAVQGGSQVKG